MLARPGEQESAGRQRGSVAHPLDERSDSREATVGSDKGTASAP